MPTQPNLILASSSSYRKAQLGALGIDVKAIAADIDETPYIGENPAELATRLAAAKAEKISKLFPDAIVIGSDQVALVATPEGNHLLGKPRNYTNAYNQLMLCRGRIVTFYSALSLCCTAVDKQVTEIDTTKVHFTALTPHHIQNYLLAETPYDCAGSFKSEGKGVLLFERIESRDPNALIGLPVMLLRDLLVQFEVDLLSLATSPVIGAAAT